MSTKKMTYEDSILIKTLQNDEPLSSLSLSAQEKSKLIVDMMKIGIPARPGYEVKEEIELIRYAD